MSFSRDIKIELIENKPMRRHYRNAMAYGLFFHSQQYSEKEISLKTKFLEVAEHFRWLAESVLGKHTPVKISNVSQGDVYRVWIPQKTDRENLIAYFEGEKERLLEKEEALFAFIAGAFLACGNSSDPNKQYHLEFVTPMAQRGTFLYTILEERIPSMATMMRRNRYVIYCKECNQIQDILTMMGASKASLYMIEVEMFKTVRNHANRVTNCETANIDKQVDAATAQIEDIKLVLEVKGEKGISKSLLETAKLRINNPYASLRELMELSPTPISRSGLHHRLTVLTQMATRIREEGGEKAHV